MAGKNKPAAARIRPARRPAATTTPREATDLSRELPPSAPPVPAENPADWEEALDDARKALGDTANLVRALWISFIFFGLYLTVAAGGITHRQLFLETPISLPIVGASLPLVAFFWIAPFLFVVGHAYMLLHLTLMAERAQRYVQLADAGNMSPEIRARSDGQLPSHVFIEFLTAEKDGKRRAVGRVVRFITWFTMVIAPVALLLLIQISFLPYQDQPTTWVHRLLLLADLAIIVVYWPKVSREEVSAQKIRRRRIRLLAAGSLGAVVFSLAVATSPNEPHDDNIVSRALEFALPQWVGHCGDAEKCDPITFRDIIVRNTLVLHDDVLVDAEKVEKILAREKDTPPGESARSLTQTRSRSYVGGSFNRADLRLVDFRNADLRAARMIAANMQGANLDRANLAGANLSGAKLQRASMRYTGLDGASLTHARVQGATFDSAWLRGAELYGAELQGSRFDHAHLQAADFSYSRLDGAYLVAANLMGAKLNGASLTGTSLDFTHLQGASFFDATLTGASMQFAFIWRTNGMPKDMSALRVNDARPSQVLDGMEFGIGFGDTHLDLVSYLSIINRSIYLLENPTKIAVENRLLLLDPEGPAPSDEIKLDVWEQVAKGYEELDHILIILRIICKNYSPPHISQTMMDTKLLAIFRNTPYDVADPVLEDIRSGNCLGMDGLSKETIADLFEWIDSSISQPRAK